MLVQRIFWILLFSATVILVTIIGLVLFEKSFPYLAVAAPTISGLIPIAPLIRASRRKNISQISTFRLCLLVTLPLGITGSMFAIQGIAMSAMSGMRW